MMFLSSSSTGADIISWSAEDSIMQLRTWACGMCKLNTTSRSCNSGRLMDLLVVISLVNHIFMYVYTYTPIYVITVPPLFPWLNFCRSL
jgi:hypothetical protein